MTIRILFYGSDKYVEYAIKDCEINPSESTTKWSDIRFDIRFERWIFKWSSHRNIGTDAFGKITAEWQSHLSYSRDIASITKIKLAGHSLQSDWAIGWSERIGFRLYWLSRPPCLANSRPHQQFPPSLESFWKSCPSRNWKITKVENLWCYVLRYALIDFNLCYTFNS